MIKMKQDQLFRADQHHDGRPEPDKENQCSG
jgi:hypothetical protein